MGTFIFWHQGVWSQGLSARQALLLLELLYQAFCWVFFWQCLKVFNWAGFKHWLFWSLPPTWVGFTCMRNWHWVRSDIFNPLTSISSTPHFFTCKMIFQKNRVGSFFLINFIMVVSLACLDNSHLEIIANWLIWSLLPCTSNKFVVYIYCFLFLHPFADSIAWILSILLL
jgi:hypothetical protein